MTGVGGDTGRGARVAARGLRTWLRLVERAMVVALAGAIVAATWKTWDETSSHDWHVMGVYALCEFMLAAGFDPDRRKTIRDLDGQVYSNSLASIVTFEPILRLRDRIIGLALDAAMLGFGSGAALVALYLAAMHIVGGSLRRGRRLRGGELVASGELARRALPLHRRARRLLRHAESRFVPHRRHPLALRRRDPPHDRLRHHRLGQDRADRRPGGADPGARRALRRLRQDGLLHRDLLRSRARRAAQPHGRPCAALVSLRRGPYRPRLRHHGGGHDPAAEGCGRPLLDHGGPPALLPRRRRALEARRDPQPGAGRPPAQDRAEGAGRRHGGHRRPVNRRSREPQDRALGPGHAHGQHRRHGPAAGRRDSHSRSGSGSNSTAEASCSSPRGATSTRACGA